jgi:hypothetical protein
MIDRILVLAVAALGATARAIQAWQRRRALNSLCGNRGLLTEKQSARFLEYVLDTSQLVVEGRKFCWWCDCSWPVPQEGEDELYCTCGADSDWEIDLSESQA